MGHIGVARVGVLNRGLHLHPSLVDRVNLQHVGSSLLGPNHVNGNTAVTGSVGFNRVLFLSALIFNRCAEVGFVVSIFLWSSCGFIGSGWWFSRRKARRTIG